MDDGERDPLRYLILAVLAAADPPLTAEEITAELERRYAALIGTWPVREPRGH